MNPRYYLLFILVLSAFTMNGLAGEYKTTAAMTDAEYQKVREASAEYNECLNEFAITQLDKQTDPRIIADHAMKNCASILEDLYDFFVLGNYAPEAISRFVGNISNNGANKLLSNLMRFMAAQPGAR